MVERKTIGKIQLALGLFIALLLIIGVIIAYPKYKEVMNDLTANSWGYLMNDNFSNETKAISRLVYVDLTLSAAGIGVSSGITIASCSAILFFLSIIMILQGLANTAEEKKV